VEFVYNSLLVLHFIGLAALLGSFIGQMKGPDRVVQIGMLHGALTQLVTGIAMVGLRESGAYDDPDPIDTTKIAVKLALTLIVTVLVFLGRKREGDQTPLWGAIGGLTLANVVLAVFW
jgi:hypothetical protein